MPRPLLRRRSRPRTPNAPACARTAVSSALVDQSRYLWSQVSPPAPGDDAVPTLPRVGPDVSTAEFASRLMRGDWDELAAVWPALDPSQRITVVYAVSRVPLPPGIIASHHAPSDWLVAMALVSGREGLLSRAGVDARQWTTAWQSPHALLPDGLHDGPASGWVERARTSESSRHSLRRAALQSAAGEEMPFDLVWELARPLTRETVDAVVSHPDVTVEALLAVSQTTHLSPGARARLALSARFAADRVPDLYREARLEDLEPLLRATIPRARLLALLEQPLRRGMSRELVLSQPHARAIALDLDASTPALTALFLGLDLARDIELRDAALRSGRVEARRATAAAAGDPAVLAELARDPDPQVRATAAQRVLDALSPTDRAHDDEEIPL